MTSETERIPGHEVPGFVREVTANSAIAHRLADYLDRDKEGYPTDLRSPIPGRRIPRAEAMGEWFDRRKRVDIPEWLSDLEDKEDKLVGPYSIKHPWSERRERALEYFSNKEGRFNEAALDAAQQKLALLIPRGSLRPASLTTAFEGTPKNTNWGVPLFTSDKGLYIQYLQRAESFDPWYPSVLGWRGQQRGPKPSDVAQRIVFMEDHALTIRSKQLQIPLLNVMKMLPEFVAMTNQRNVNNHITNLYIKFQNRLKQSLDWSGFDRRAVKRLIDVVWEVTTSWFQLTPETEKIIDYVRSGFQEQGLVTPEGIFDGERGAVPSGDALTNVFDSLLSLLLLYYAGFVLQSDVEWATVLGDDGVAVFKGDPSIDEISGAIEPTLMVLNTDKSSESIDQVDFLQYRHHVEYALDGILAGVRSATRMIGRWIAYERFRREWNGFMDSSRVIMTTETAWANPLHHEMIQLATEWDDKLLQYDPREIINLAGGVPLLKSALDIEAFPFTNENLDNFDSFKTVQRLREIRS